MAAYVTAPLAKALDGLTTELEAQRRDRERTPEREADLEAKRHPLHGLSARGGLGLLVRIPGWERAFTRIDHPPLVAGVLSCTCGAKTRLRDRALVKCSCHRYFVLSRDVVFVTYGTPDAE